MVVPAKARPVDAECVLGTRAEPSFSISVGGYCFAALRGTTRIVWSAGDIALHFCILPTRSARERPGGASSMGDKAVITCALNGVLTDPKQHHVPVTPERDGARGQGRLQCRRQRHAHPSAPAGAGQGPPAVMGGQCLPRDPAGDPRGLSRRHHQSHHRHLGARIIRARWIACARRGRRWRPATPAR